MAREFAKDHALNLTARSGEKMDTVAKKIGSKTMLLDATEVSAVAPLFNRLSTAPTVVIFNSSARVRGPI